MNEKTRKEFEAITKPVIKWLNENFHPHCSIHIDTDRAELVEGMMAFQTNEFIKG